MADPKKAAPKKKAEPSQADRLAALEKDMAKMQAVMERNGWSL